jgi:DNA-directed RNA polymerase subunit RPC12/RpoP
MILESTITCPECGTKKLEQMPENTCQAFYRCSHCKKQIKAREGDCCVYCCYADTPCPQAQFIGSACCARD